jgi:hypothetical protein
LGRFTEFVVVLLVWEKENWDISISNNSRRMEKELKDYQWIKNKQISVAEDIAEK